MIMTNSQMLTNIEVLNKLNETGKLGYAIARNLRKLKDSATEYIDMRQKTFAKYGQQTEDGRLEIPLSIYKEQVGDIAAIEHDVDIYQIDEETFFSGSLDSQQMEQLIWMVEE